MKNIQKSESPLGVKHAPQHGGASRLPAGGDELPAFKFDSPASAGALTWERLEPRPAASLQLKSGGGAAPTAGKAAEIAQSGVGSSGGRLPFFDQIQQSFGGHDISGARAHQGGRSSQASEALGARAYTFGNDVVFGQSPDLHTAAHEATHVVQQRGGVQLKGGVGQSGDVYEQHADAVADRVVRGESAGELLGTMAGGAGGAPAVQREEKEGDDKKVEEKKADSPSDPSSSSSSSAPPPPESPGVPATLVALAGSLNARSVAAWRSDEKTMLAILKGPFEANWFKAKDCLLMDHWPIEQKVDHAVSLDLMQGLVDMRSKVCEKVVKATTDGLPAELKRMSAALLEKKEEEKQADPAAELKSAFAAEAEKPAEQQVTFLPPAGNQKRTSDIDVSTNGANTEIAVRLFNQIFREQLEVPYDPGTVFDYNVYAMDWIHKASEQKLDMVTAHSKKENKDVKVPTRLIPGVEHKAVEEPSREARSAAMDDHALLHVRRFCSAGEWRQYIEERVAQAPIMERLELRKRLMKIDQRYKAFVAETEERMVAVGEEMGAALGGVESAWGEHNEHFQHEAVKLRASNAIYQERLLMVKALRLQYTLLAGKAPKTGADLEEMTHLATQVADKLSEATFFANEVYATEGATLHVVVGMQTAAKQRADTGVELNVALTPAQYMQSFHENVGDSLKDLDHFKDDPPFAVYRAGKYVDRMLQASDRLTPQAKEHRFFPDLAKIAHQAVVTKESAKADDPVEAKKDFAEFKAGHLPELRSKVLSFGADVPSNVRREEIQARELQEKKADEKKPDDKKEGESASAASSAPAPAPTRRPLSQRMQQLVAIYDRSARASSNQGGNQDEKL